MKHFHMTVEQKYIDDQLKKAAEIFNDAMSKAELYLPEDELKGSLYNPSLSGRADQCFHEIHAIRRRTVGKIQSKKRA